MCISWRINIIAELTFSVNNGARKMEFGSLDDGEDGEHNDVGFVEISKILTLQNAFPYGAVSFDKV